MVSSSLLLQLFHLALLVRVGGMFFHGDFIRGSLNLKLGAPRFSGYLQNSEVVAYCSYLVLVLSLTMVVSSPYPLWLKLSRLRFR